MTKPKGFEIEEYQEVKRKVINLIKDQYLSKAQISDHTKLSARQLTSILQNLNRWYDIETKINKKTREKLYKIVGEHSDTKQTLNNVLAITELGTVISRNKLIAWNIKNPIYNVRDVNSLIDLAKSFGISVYKFSGSGQKVFY